MVKSAYLCAALFVSVSGITAAAPADSAKRSAAPSVDDAAARDEETAKPKAEVKEEGDEQIGRGAATDPPLAPGLPTGLRYLDEPALRSLFVLSPDMGPLKAAVNRLNNQVLVSYYEREWRRWN